MKLIAAAACLLVAQGCIGARRPCAGVPIAQPAPAPPDADVARLVGRFEHSDGPARARELVADADAARRASPAVLAKFKTSLAARVRSPIFYEPDVPAVHVRKSSLILFRSLRGEASAALPDLLELLRRRELEDEYAGTSWYIAETVIAAVSEGDPSLVIEAARHEHRAVRVACCRALGYMKHSASSAGPALTDMLGDPDLMVVREAARGLGKLDWVTREALRRVKLRAEQESNPWNRSILDTIAESFSRRLDPNGAAPRR